MNPTMTQVRLAQMMLEINESCPRCFLSRTRGDGTEVSLELGYPRYAGGDQAVFRTTKAGAEDGLAIVSVYSAARAFLSND